MNTPENFPVDLTKFDVSPTLERILKSIVKNDCTDPSEIRIAMGRAKIEGEDKLYKELESKLLPLSIQKQERRKEEKKKKQDEIDQKAKEREELFKERQLETQLLKKELEEKELRKKKQLQEERMRDIGSNTHVVDILGPFWAGDYWGMRKHPAEHDAHQLSLLLEQNKRWKHEPELTEEQKAEICNEMCNKLETVREDFFGNFPPLDKIEIIVPVPNGITRYPEPRCALPIAAELAAIICERGNRKNCHSYVHVLVRPNHTRKWYDRGPARRESAENDYDVAEDIKTAENSMIKDQTVLLIDDISTSGETAKVCAKLLVQYGAKQVIILCAAKTKKG